MSGFSADWLALREPHDHAARAGALTGRLAAWLTRRGAVQGATRDGSPVRLVDLGCGTGSNLRYLAPRIDGAQHWTLVDHDPALLARLAPPLPPAHPASAAPQRPTIAIAPQRLDLAGPLDPIDWAGTDCVTAAALIDLVSVGWLARLVETATRGGRRPAWLIALSYDGRHRWSPADPEDGEWLDRFNRHQTMDKGFGAAAGPAATDALAASLSAHGYRVQRSRSDWRLGPADGAIQQAIASGSVAAFDTAWPTRAGDLAGWLSRRTSLIAAGRSTLTVGHEDLLALPDAG